MATVHLLLLAVLLYQSYGVTVLNALLQLVTVTVTKQLNASLQSSLKWKKEMIPALW